MSLREKLDGLRAELVDLAFTLDRQGDGVAADVAMTTAARVRELLDEGAQSDNCADGVRKACAGSLDQ